MKLLIKVDEITLGSFIYRAYIFEHKEQKVGFGIFLDGFKNPMIMFEAVAETQVRVSVNETQVRFIGEQSKSGMEDRANFYRDFMDFVKASEKVAALKIFPKKDIQYLANYASLTKMKGIYMNENKS